MTGSRSAGKQARRTGPLIRSMRTLDRYTTSPITHLRKTHCTPHRSAAHENLHRDGTRAAYHNVVAGTNGVEWKWRPGQDDLVRLERDADGREVLGYFGEGRQRPARKHTAIRASQQFAVAKDRNHFAIQFRGIRARDFAGR